MPLKSFIVLFFLLCLQFCASSDTITSIQALKDGHVLVSEGGKFALGFFSPGNTSSRYVGIWYNKVSEQTVVWVANRDRPINNSFGILTINKDGNLLLSAQNIPIWSTNISQPVSSNGSQAHILDSGNLILLLGDKRNVLWQSFDYPTHTFLPGMKLGLNKKSHQNWTITSWRSTNDPGHGDYSFQVDPNGSPQFFLYMGSNPIWRTGPWVGQRRSGVRDMTRAYIFNYSLVSNKDEVSLTYTVLNPSVISVFMVDGVTGTVLRKTWHEDSHRWIKFWSAPKEQCDDYGECGAYGSCNSNSGNQFMCSCFPGYRPRSPRDWYFRDGSGGCVRIENRSMCGNGEGFSRLSSVKLPDTSKAEVNMSMTMEECRENCLRNCSCMGYTTADETTNNGCIAFYERLIDTRLYASEGKDLFFRLDAVELAKYNKMKRGHARKTLKAILIVVMVLALTALLSFSYWLYFKKKKRELDEQSERALWTKDSDESDSTSADLPFLHRRVIASATNNFNPDNKLGEGGFGSVYKGQLHNGQEIAVKRLAKNSGQGIEEFKNEVRSIAKLQHRNLVRMLGCCVEGDEKMLIYEYLPNKSLDKFIFDEEKRSSLDWKKRFEIIMGIARGILYLHQDSRFRIIHRDLKASNVLLDADLLPKISDFGIARIFSSDQIEANTNRVVGTYGYMSPEYAMEGLFSIKSDVFSFGVLLLEIISGRKNSGYYQDNPSVNLIGHVWELWKEGKALDITDPTLAAFGHDIDNEEEMLRCIQIGLLCVQEQAHDRLTMAAVIFMLSNRADQLPPPKQPAFVFKASHHHRAHDNPSSSSTGAHSVNELTVTMVEGR